jgi:hypothetical protein
MQRGAAEPDADPTPLETASFPLGTTVCNDASIVFDFNPLGTLRRAVRVLSKVLGGNRHGASRSWAADPRGVAAISAPIRIDPWILPRRRIDARIACP